jgi:cytochrome P450
VEKARPMIEKIVARLLDDIAATPAGEPVDVKSRSFYPLAATVIRDLFGFPESARAGVLQGSVVTSKTTNSAEQAEANLHQWQSAMTDLVETKRREPGDDLTTTLISAREEGDT